MHEICTRAAMCSCEWDRSPPRISVVTVLGGLLGFGCNCSCGWWYYSDGNDDDNDGENAKREIQREKSWRIVCDVKKLSEVRCAGDGQGSPTGVKAWIHKKSGIKNAYLSHNLGIDTNHQTHLRHSEGLPLQITVHPLTTLPTSGQVFVTLSIFHAHYKVPQPNLSAPSAVMLWDNLSS